MLLYTEKIHFRCDAYSFEYIFNDPKIKKLVF